MQGLMYGGTAAMGWKEGGWGMGSTLATAMFLWMTLRQLFPNFSGDLPLRRWAEKLLGSFYPFVDISFPEFSGDRFNRSAAFSDIESYLSATCGGAARRLRAELGRDSSKLVFSMDEHQEVVDHFEGVSFWWRCSVSMTKSSPFSFLPSPEEKRSYWLSFHRRHRRLVEDKYLNVVMEKGKEIAASRRQRKLFTNSSSRDGVIGRKVWSHVPFEHPASFETLAMDPGKKEELIRDLLSFRERKEYYARVGKAWKRGYLLYGPPGTGKSSTIAAMANLLEYDVYDLELTAVKDNSSLRRLLIETSSKSIMVVEDIDCSLELTGSRLRGGAAAAEKSEEEKVKEKVIGRDSEESKVTLSGLLNFIDGLWSACGGERIIVFTTNHIEKLDPALIRRGRMDKHVELSYCRFEAFKLLAKNYLGVTEHPLFAQVQPLIEEVDITPADVAELLMPGTNSGGGEEDCLRAVVRDLEEKKARATAEAAEKTETVVAEVRPEKVPPKSDTAEETGTEETKF